MAHFAQLDANNVVTNVIVVGDQNCLGDGGIESEQVGIDFCRNTFGSETRWAQTSITGRIRKNYAGIGYSYDAQLDAFIPPQPFASWLLDEATCLWVAPIPEPNDGAIYYWNEELGQWVAVELPPETT
jgi:hypothetical protein